MLLLVSDTPINFYGDPLQDFSLNHFLERFVFKNPKKAEQRKIVPAVQQNRHHKPFGSRGQPINQLTASNCTEDERFIFEFLNKKRERQANLNVEKDSNEIDDDEFDAYLDGLGSKKKNKGEDEDEDEEPDFLADFNELTDKKRKKRSKHDDDADENEDFDDDDGDGDEDGDDDDGEGSVGLGRSSQSDVSIPFLFYSQSR